MAASDEELMAAYLAGDQGAFRALFERYAPRVLRLMQRGRPNDPEAPDLVQQTFLQLHRARRDFRRGARLRPWLFTIAANCKRDHCRRAGRRREEPTDVEPTAPGAGPVNGIAQRQTAGEVRAALDALPTGQREVIELHWFAELSFAEVAESLGLKLSAAKVRAHRGYGRLRQILGDVATGERRTHDALS